MVKNVRVSRPPGLIFTTRAIFIKVFKKFTGMTPKQYRNAEFRPDGFDNFR
ncbi:helix-turn-helix transcriptional regulator [Paenibacillus motobuensis]|uniref:helix-turn-helix transcriptional regulator n=1 Tax=Paenibacillus motobuensis TaxID=295324 RepID=UPI0036257E74